MAKNPSKKSIREALFESVFDPRQQNSPMSVVVSLNDPGYCQTRAIELIHEAKMTSEPTQHREKLTQAISLLVLAKVQNNGSIESP